MKSDFIIDEVVESKNGNFSDRAFKIGDWLYQLNWHGQVLFKTKEILKQTYNSYNTKYIVLKRGKYQIATNLWGKILFKKKCDELVYLQDDIFKFKVGKFWGLIYKDGFVLIKPKYQEIFLGCIDTEIYHRRTFYAKLNDKFGVICSNDEIVKPFIYDEIPVQQDKYINYEFIEKNKDKYADIIDLGVHKHFSDGDYFVKNDECYWGLIKESGETVFDYKYLSIDTFNMINAVFEYGTAYRVQNENGKWGLFDNYENIILPFEFDYIMKHCHLGNNTLIVAKNNKFGLVDLKNNTKINFKYKNLIDLNGYGDMFLAQDDRDKWAIINDKDEIINPDFDKIFELKLNKKKSFYYPKKVKNFRKSDFIFDSASYYWDKNTTTFRKGDYIYIINSLGEILFKFIKTKYIIHEQYNGFIIFKNDDKKFVTDKSGNILIKPIYQDIEFLYFKDYFKYYENGKWGVINSNGKILVEAKYDEIDCDYNKYFSAELNGKTGLIDENDNIILPFEYDNNFHFFDNNTKIVATKNDKQGIINLKNKILIPFDYDYITTPNLDINKDYIVVENHINKDKTSCGVIDWNNNIVLPFEYANLSIVSNKTLLGNKESMDCINYLYDLKGNKICDISFDTFWKLDDTDYYIASHRHENCRGLADKYGKPIIDFKYKEFNPEYSKKENKFYFIVQNILGAWGVIDINDNVIIPFVYDELWVAGNIDNSLIAKNNNTYGLIDINNSILVDFKFKTIDDTYGLIDINNSILVDFKFKTIYGFSDAGYTIAKSQWCGSKWGLINTKGESIKFDLKNVKELKL